MSDQAPLPVGFRDVDATAPEKIVRCLECIATLAAGRAYKARSVEALGLGPGSAALAAWGQKAATPSRRGGRGRQGRETPGPLSGGDHGKMSRSR